MSTPLPTADSAKLDPPDAVEVDFIARGLGRIYDSLGATVDSATGSDASAGGRGSETTGPSSEPGS